MHPKTKLLEKLSDLRHMLHVMDSPYFDEAYASNKIDIDKAIENIDRDSFDALIRKSKSLQEMTVRELVVRAKKKGIFKYSRLDKTTLIRELNANT